MRLKNKRILVVGASSGLGRESGFALAREGAVVGFAARRIDRIEAAAEQAGGGAFSLSSCGAIAEAGRLRLSVELVAAEVVAVEGSTGRSAKLVTRGILYAAVRRVPDCVGSASVDSA